MTIPKNEAGFRGWLGKQMGRDDLVADFAVDVSRDVGAPAGDASREAWLSYLLSVGASQGAISACEEAWDEYEQYGI